MRHRVRSCLVGSALLACVTVLGDCGGDPLPDLCSYTSVPLEANALTLLADARLDKAGPGFLLLGSDKDNIRWATLSAAGALGIPGMVAVPAHSDGPWFGAAGTTASPGSSVVVAYAANPAAGMADLMTFAVDVATGTASTPAMIAKVPDRGTSPVIVATGSGRAGENVGIAWGQVGTSTVSALVLGPDGRPLAGPINAGSVQDLDCLRFVPGKNDLTLSYVRPDPEGTFTLYFQELAAGGQPGPARTLPMGNVRVGCPAFVPAPVGYGIAWKELGTPPSSHGRGDVFAAIGDGNAPFLAAIVLSNERVSGGDAPPVVGLGSTSNTKFTLLFAQRSGGQAWQVDQRGNKTSQPITLPSTHGNTGAVSTSPVGTSLFATYADYSSADPTNQAAGTRLFLEVTCK